ncbi:MAG TPA: thrombospondin type 3 repeat-containing protein [Thermoleophilaceae bacterium]
MTPTAPASKGKLVRRGVLAAAVSLALLAGSAGSATAANLVQNPSFEDGSYRNCCGAGTWMGLEAGDTDITGWTIGGDGVDWSDQTVQNAQPNPDTGTKFVDLNRSGPPGSISQSVPTVAGAEYLLTFRHSAHPLIEFCGTGPRLLRASAGSASRDFSADPVAEGYANGTNLYKSASLTFTGAAGATTIEFASLVSTCGGPLVDTVSVTLVDDDGDGAGNGVDNCPGLPNDQTDSDGDGRGDACDSDDDGDGVADSADAFPLDPAEHVDTDGDGTGNGADSDDDGDGVPDASDACATEYGRGTANGCPLPADRDQCRSGGYAGYGDKFANQGACIRFVVRSTPAL